VQASLVRTSPLRMPLATSPAQMNLASLKTSANVNVLSLIPQTSAGLSPFSRACCANVFQSAASSGIGTSANGDLKMMAMTEEGDLARKARMQ
jgi:hypothetical protein